MKTIIISLIAIISINAQSSNTTNPLDSTNAQSNNIITFQVIETPTQHSTTPKLDSILIDINTLKIRDQKILSLLSAFHEDRQRLELRVKKLEIFIQELIKLSK